MRVAGILTALAVGVAALTPGAVEACSPGPGLSPDNFELVALAESIVVARADSLEGETTVRFETLFSLKGEGPDTFTLHGQFGRPLPSDAHTLNKPHPDAFAGMCNRVLFEPGRDYVIFLQTLPNGTLSQSPYPFRRVNEDYLGRDSLWVRTIEAYLDIQSAPKDDQQQRLIALRDGLGDSVDDRALAADIEGQLTRRSEPRP